MLTKRPGFCAIALAMVLFAEFASATTITTLAAFTSVAGDPAFPRGALVADPSGNLYGTSEMGGSFNDGTVFKISAGTHTHTNGAGIA
jgi:uncharacterized repeat protein (TIGR03803 family)